MPRIKEFEKSCFGRKWPSPLTISQLPLTRRQFIKSFVGLCVFLRSPIAWAGDAIHVGLIGPMTGPNALNGQQMREAAEVAVDYYNEGLADIGGRKLELIIEDDAGDPRQAVAAANRMLSRAPVRFVVGHATSSTTIPASSIYKESGVVLLAPVNADLLTQAPSPYIIRIIPANASYEVHMVDEILASGRRNIAIIHNGTEYGMGLAERLTQHLNRQGITERLFEGVTVGEKDYATFITKCRDAQVNVIVLALYPQEASLLMRQSIEMGFISLQDSNDKKPLVIGHSLLASQEFYNASGGAAEGVKVVAVTGCDKVFLQKELLESSHLKNVIRAFKHRNVSIETTHTIIFSAFQIIMQTVVGAEKDRIGILTELHRRAFRTIRGELAFNDQGELRNPDKSLALYEIRPTGPHMLKAYGANQ